jgi:hypothetical protein
MVYKIVWQSKITGYRSEGSPSDNLTELEVLTNRMNKEYPDIDHWILPVDESNQKGD